MPRSRSSACGGALDDEGAGRVRRAIVSLSNGALGKLRYFTDQARRDYRDVLYWAENQLTRTNLRATGNSATGWDCHRTRTTTAGSAPRKWSSTSSVMR